MLFCVLRTLPFCGNDLNLRIRVRGLNLLLFLKALVEHKVVSSSSRFRFRFIGSVGTENLVRFRSRFVNSWEPNYFFVLGSLISQEANFYFRSFP